MSEATDLLAWIAKAEEDYTVARLVLRQKTPLTGSACFHAQQCAEKYLKAALIARSSQFPKVHDLLKLSQICEQVGLRIPIDTDQLDRLSAYAIQVRYPGDAPTPDEAREALETAKRVRRFVRKSLAIT